jgi:hypothetical protein
MLLPSSWNKLKRKRQPNISVEEDVDVAASDAVLADTSVIKTNIKDSLHARQSGRAPDEPDDFTWLLSKMSIAKMLTSVPRSVGASVPIVSRKYEEAFMRECMNSSERSCIFKGQCECMKIDVDNAFVGVQFELPTLTNVRNGMCILCLRKSTHVLFYNILKQGHSTQTVIQKYGNICNEPGEYHPSAMLICPPNGPVHSLPMPIVAHQRNRYSVVHHHGIKYMKQHRVYMEDFQ